MQVISSRSSQASVRETTEAKGREERGQKGELVTWTDPWLSFSSSDCSRDREMRWTDGRMSSTASCS